MATPIHRNTEYSAHENGDCAVSPPASTASRSRPSSSVSTRSYCCFGAWSSQLRTRSMFAARTKAGIESKRK
jgi:hypothetical protein